MRTLRLVVPVLAILASTLLFACGDDDTTGPGGGGGTPIDVSGTASKGDIDAATVNLHRFTATGGMGARVAGPFTTDATGAWSGTVPSGTNEDLLVVVSGGSYVDESTGNTVDLTSDLYGVWRPSTKKGNASPVTHSLVVNAQARIANGVSVSTAITSALQEIEAAFGFDPTSLDPSLKKRGEEGTPSQIYAAFLAGFSALVDDNPMLGAFTEADVWNLIIACALDMSDGVLQGLDALGEPILVDPDGPGPGTPLQIPVIDVNDISTLIDFANDWASTNLPGIFVPNIDLSDFGDTTISVGNVTVSGFLDVNGIGFPSPFVPTVVGYSQNEVATAFVFADNAFNNVSVSILNNPFRVIQVLATTNTGSMSWATESQITNTVEGMTVSNQSIEWVIGFDSVVVDAVNAEGPLTLNRTLTVLVPEE